MNFGVPMLAGVLASWTVMAEYDLRGRAAALVDRVHDAIVDRPQFTITEIDVPDVSRDLAEQIRVAAFVRLPASSLELDVGAVRERIEALDAVERARVRALPSGVLEIRAIERVPVVLWRSPGGLELLDQDGVRVAEVDSRHAPAGPAADRRRRRRGARARGAGGAGRGAPGGRAGARAGSGRRTALGPGAGPRPGDRAARGRIRRRRSAG